MSVRCGWRCRACAPALWPGRQKAGGEGDLRLRGKDRLVRLWRPRPGCPCAGARPPLAEAGETLGTVYCLRGENEMGVRAGPTPGAIPQRRELSRALFADAERGAGSARGEDIPRGLALSRSQRLPDCQGRGGKGPWTLHLLNRTDSGKAGTVSSSLARKGLCLPEAPGASPLAAVFTTRPHLGR